MNATDHDHLRNGKGSSGMNQPRGSRGEHLMVRGVGSALSRPLKTALLMVILVGGFYLFREHANHIAGNWIYLLLLACPLMHLFHGHGGHGGHATPLSKPAAREE